VPLWVFLLLLAALIAYANVGLYASSLWVVGRLKRAGAAPFTRMLKVTGVLAVLEIAAIAAAALAGVDIFRPTSVAVGILFVAYAAVSRTWVARALLGRGWMGGFLGALGAGILHAVTLIVTLIPVRLTLLDFYVSPTASMSPTIPVGGRILTDRTATPRRWDVVVYRSPQNRSLVFAHRLVGLPGETVEVLDGSILIDGVEAPLPPELHGALFRTRARAGVPEIQSPVTLGPDEYYVIGDNTQAASAPGTARMSPDRGAGGAWSPRRTWSRWSASSTAP
jgi:signal peptidase I